MKKDENGNVEKYSRSSEGEINKQPESQLTMPVSTVRKEKGIGSSDEDDDETSFGSTSLKRVTFSNTPLIHIYTPPTPSPPNEETERWRFMHGQRRRKSDFLWPVPQSDFTSSLFKLKVSHVRRTEFSSVVCRVVVHLIN